MKFEVCMAVNIPMFFFRVVTLSGKYCLHLQDWQYLTSSSTYLQRFSVFHYPFKINKISTTEKNSETPTISVWLFWIFIGSMCSRHASVEMMQNFRLKNFCGCFSYQILSEPLCWIEQSANGQMERDKRDNQIFHLLEEFYANNA